MLDALTEDTTIAIVFNPNNPTDTAHHDADLADFIAAGPPQVLIVLDEAYREYFRDLLVCAG